MFDLSQKYGHIQRVNIQLLSQILAKTEVIKPGQEFTLIQDFEDSGFDLKWWKEYLASFEVLGIVEPLLEVAGNLGVVAVLELFEHFSEMIILGVLDMDGILVADTKSSFHDLP